MKARTEACAVAALLSALLAVLSGYVGIARAQLAPNTTTYPNEAPARTLGPAPGEKFTALSSGRFTYSKTDLTLPGSMPIQISRVYRSRDLDTGGNWLAHNFGLGTRLNYDIFLYSNSEQVSPPTYTDAEVVMPDGGEIMCARETSTCASQSCSDYTGPSSTNPAVFRCNLQPTGAWFAATLTYNWSNSGWDLRRKDGTVYHFGYAAPLQSITDRFGNTLTITRGGTQGAGCNNLGKGIGSSDIAAVSSSDGRSVNFCYDDPNYADGISRIFDNTGTKQVDYTYDSNRNHQLLTVTRTSYNPNAVTTYNYGGGGGGTGDISSIVVNTACTSSSGCSPDKNYTYVTYAGSAAKYSVASVSPSTPSAGYQYSYTYDSTNTYIQEVVITFPDSYHRALYYDSLGYLVKDERHPFSSDEEVAVFNRGQGGNDLISSVSEQDASGNVWRTTQYGWDFTSGDLLSVTVSPAPGTPSTATPSATSATWTYSYEPAYHRVASFKEPLSNKPTTITYSDSTDQYSITDPLGRTTKVAYNPQGQTISVTDAYGYSATTGYNSYGDVVSATDEAGDLTQYVLDQVGRVRLVISPLNEDTSYAYDGGDHVTSRTDPKTSAGTPVTTYTYDLVGDIASVTTPNGNTTKYARPATLDKVTITDPLGNQAVINFDASGRTQTYTDKRGVVTTYSYDAFGRLSGFSSDSPTVCGGYDPNDYRKTSYTYDALDRVTQMVNDQWVDAGYASCNGLLIYDQQFNYTYDGIDDVMSESQTTTYTSGATVQPPSQVAYQYDLNGRRTSVQMTVNGSSLPAVNYVYDCADELVEMSNGGPLTVSSCSPSNYVTGCHAGEGAQVGLCYDSDGRRTGLNAGNVYTSYGYDAASRLTGLTYSNLANQTRYGNLTYQYDKDSQVYDEGGSLAAIAMPTPATATYLATDQVGSWNGTAAGVDKAGNITTDPTNGAAYAWDVRNELVTSTALPGSPVVYDQAARRENLPSIPGSSTYLYDGEQAIQNDNGGLATNYLRMPGSGEVLMESASGTNAVPLHGADGSAVAMVDAGTGAITSQYSYDPLGGTTVSGQGYQTAYQYRGMENNGWTYYGGHRYYSPKLGRFLSLQGPLASAGGYNSGAFSAAAALGAGSPSGSGIGDYAAQSAEDMAAGAAAGFAVEAGSVALGADTGWSAGPLGAAVGAAIGGLVGLFEDLFGGGGGGGPPPWIVWKLTHQGGNLQIWAQKDGLYPDWAPSQQPLAGEIPSQTAAGGGVIPVQFWRYNYCGPGNNGGPALPGTTDSCCQAHDNCYGREGLSGRDVLEHFHGAGAGSWQKQCDRDLCNCVKGLGNTYHPYDELIRLGALATFCY